MLIYFFLKRLSLVLLLTPPEEPTTFEKRSNPLFLWSTLDVETYFVRLVMPLRFHTDGARTTRRRRRVLLAFRTHGNLHSVTVDRDGPGADPHV